MPAKDETAWFIRPHHVESLTQHHNSIKDDFLNTRYFSHYNQTYGKETIKSHNEVAIDYIEKQIENLKLQQEELAAKKHINPSDFGEDRAKVMREAQVKFDEFIVQKELIDGKSRCIEAYETILYDRRRHEKDILNAERKKEIEKNRPPEPNWYMLHSKEFSKELYRNRVALRPHNSNQAYLENLRDPSIY